MDAHRRTLVPRVVIAATVVLAVGALAGLAIADPLAPGPEPEADRRALISDDGSYKGVGIGDAVTSVRGRFGGCQSSTGATSPLAYDLLAEHATPSTGQSSATRERDKPNLVCPLVSFSVDDEISSIEVVDPAAETSRGVGRGDPLAEARDAYPEVRCEVNMEGTERSSFPQCHGRLGAGPYVWFGGDPVRTIAYSRTPFLCGGECPPWP